MCPIRCPFLFEIKGAPLRLKTLINRLLRQLEMELFDSFSLENYYEKVPLLTNKAK